MGLPYFSSPLCKVLECLGVIHFPNGVSSIRLCQDEGPFPVSPRQLPRCLAGSHGMRLEMLGRERTCKVGTTLSLFAAGILCSKSPSAGWDLKGAASPAQAASSSVCAISDQQSVGTLWGLPPPPSGSLQKFFQ